MSSVSVLIGKKKLSVFCEKKKSKCPKKNFQSVKKGKKNVSVEFRVSEKKGKVRKKKNQSVLGGNFAKFVFTG